MQVPYLSGSLLAHFTRMVAVHPLQYLRSLRREGTQLTDCPATEQDLELTDYLIVSVLTTDLPSPQILKVYVPAGKGFLSVRVSVAPYCFWQGSPIQTAYSLQGVPVTSSSNPGPSTTILRPALPHQSGCISTTQVNSVVPADSVNGSLVMLQICTLPAGVPCC